MKTGTLLLLSAIVIGLFILAYLFSRKVRPGSHEETISYPPFKKKKKNIYSSRYDFNTGRTVDDSRSYYSIYYKDKLLTLPEALNLNSGVPGLWKVLILKDALQPALLAGSKSVYLITESEDTCKITPLSEQESDFASFQWLDSQNGQPGAKQELYSTDDTNKDCQFSVSRFLLINRSVVLDVNDLSIHPVNINWDQTQGYSENNVIAFSPDKKSMVFMGSKYDGKDYYALLTHNFISNHTQALPFDRTETRLHEPYMPAQDWLNTYFSWKQNAEGHEVLEKRSLDLLPAWEGHFTMEQSYSVAPVKEEMLDSLAAFIKEHLHLQEADVTIQQYETGKEYTFNAGHHKLEITYLDNIQTVYLSPHILDKDEDGCREAIRGVGEAFNLVLRGGVYQGLFLGY